MTVLYGDQMTLIEAGTVVDPGYAQGTVRVFDESFTMASQATTDTVVVARLPKGAVVLYGMLIASATMGASATVAIGITGTTGKYRAAAVKTTIVPEIFGVTAGLGEALTAEEDVFITIAVAALPAAGTARVMMFYTVD